jgi:hypothetical protein
MRPAALVLLAVACLARAGVAQSAPVPERRHFLQGSWTSRTLIEGEVLLKPILLRVTGRTLVILDYGDTQVKAFSLDGRPLWRFGTLGQGPWELSAPSDLQVSATGDVYIADHGNSRVTVLDGNGARLRMVPVRLPVRRILPAGDGGFLGAVGSGPHWDRFDAKGNRLGPVPVPAPLAGLGHLVTEPVNTVLGAGRSAVAFRWSDWLLILDEYGRVTASSRGPERYDFPPTVSYKGHTAAEGEIIISKVSPDATWAALSVTAVGTRIWVLFLGATRDVGRLMDSYDGTTAAYQGSLRLPGRPIAMAGVAERQLVALYDDPEPRVDLLTWVPAAR